MENNGCFTAVLSVICALCSITIFVGNNKIEELEAQNATLEAKYNVVCGSLNDCCRNMMDTYNLADSIYNHYLDVIEERGYNKLEVKHSYFCY